jgi:hypothetical protein
VNRKIHVQEHKNTIATRLNIALITTRHNTETKLIEALQPYKRKVKVQSTNENNGMKNER